MSDQILTFKPLPMERVWGGRKLESDFGKILPGCDPIGEIWEIVDREEAQSIAQSDGRSLHHLWTHCRVPVFGARHADHPSPRFPLLIKLLDARERLSVQVHPPASVAPRLGGEPKTEVWFFARTDPGAHIFAGLRHGITREQFVKFLENGTLEQALHAIPVHQGQSIFIPSGRLHAIGGGNVIIEVQQNSDTTYRVFDWNRHGLDGKPRQLHVEESLACIDFEDFEPAADDLPEGIIADCPFFQVKKHQVKGTWKAEHPDDFRIIAVAEGELTFGTKCYPAGSFLLLPASSPIHIAEGEGVVLEIGLGFAVRY